MNELKVNYVLALAVRLLTQLLTSITLQARKLQLFDRSVTQPPSIARSATSNQPHSVFVIPARYCFTARHVVGPSVCLPEWLDNFDDYNRRQ